MEPQWLYSFVDATRLAINDLASSEWSSFFRELLNYLVGLLEEYILGVGGQIPTATCPPQPMCLPEDEAKIIIPGLHRMQTNYTIDYIVYKEKYTPSEFPPMVIEQPFDNAEEYGYVIELLRALMSVIFPMLPSALRTAPLGRKTSLIISWVRLGRLFGDSWKFSGTIACLIWEWIIHLLGIMAPYMVFSMLTILAIFLVCEFGIFQRIASYEEVIEHRISQLPVDVLKLIGSAIRKIAFLVWWAVCIPQKVCIWLRYQVLPVAIKFAWCCVVESVSDYFGFLCEVFEY